MTQQFHYEYLSKENENANLNIYIYTPMFIAALFTIAKIWKLPKCPMTDKWIKTLWYINTMAYYSATKGKK